LYVELIQPEGERMYLNKKKILKDLDAGKEYIISDERVYFLSVNGYAVSLPQTYYFKRKEELSKYFSDRNEGEKKRLILENLGLFASPLPEREYHPKTEIVYQSNAVTVFKFSDYPESEDCKDVHGFKELTDVRETDMNPWRTERNDWLSELGKKIKREIFGD
jgi:hypothetical protein